MTRHKWTAMVAVVLVFLLRLSAFAVDPAWTRSIPPFRIAGNLYYVGSEDLSAYLFVTPKGNILINSTLAGNVPLIRRNVQALGFRFSDTKILLISHAHYDHCGGSALIKQLTGAKYFVMDGDVPVVESGGRADFQYGRDPTMYFAPAKVDRVLHDGDTVKLGETVLTAHLTAGHTRGTTTWTSDEMDEGKLLHVVIVGGPNLNPRTKLVGNRAHPQIASDFEHGFVVLKSLPCDVFLGAHGSYFDLMEKLARVKNGEHGVFIDPDGYKAYIADREQAFEAELKRQSAPRRRVGVSF
ncbi:MAG: subclass B3 metallo-beta-lactamase [Terracidiphilus sp.]